MQSPPAPANATNAPPAPEGWSELQRDENIQFEPVTVPEPEPQEPSAFAEWLRGISEWFADLFGPIGSALGSWWPIVQWVLIGLLALFVITLLYRLLGPMVMKPKTASEREDIPEWTPDRAESVALLEDADKLAADGKFDEATRLLLKRSVGQIARARPDWVEPSSTARELAALPALSERARSTFAVISERVERSLFALRALNRDDWETARAAYAEFALAKIDGSVAA